MSVNGTSMCTLSSSATADALQLESVAHHDGAAELERSGDQPDLLAEDRLPDPEPPAAGLPSGPALAVTLRHRALDEVDRGLDARGVVDVVHRLQRGDAWLDIGAHPVDL